MKLSLKGFILSLVIGFGVYCAAIMTFQYQHAQYEYVTESRRLNVEWIELQKKFLQEQKTPDHLEAAGMARTETIIHQIFDNCYALAANEDKWVRFETRLWIW